MSVSNADTRKLSFPLQNPEVVVGDTPNDGTPILPFSWSTTDNDEKIQVTLELSLNEYVALASAIDVGRDIAYGADTNLIWWIWTRALIEGGVMTCEQIADCIESDPDVLSAILQQLNNNGFAPDPNSASAADIVPIPQALQDQTMLPDDFDCSTPEANMAIARSIVRELHESMMDVLEIIELATNTVEAANIATDGTPILGTLNNLTEIADWYLETLTEIYVASYNQAAEDELACAIFCHLEAGCTLSINDLIDIYESAGGQVPTNLNDFAAAMTETINFTYTVSVVTVATAHCMILWTLRFGATAFGLKGWNSLAAVIKSSATYVDFSYTDCDDCEPTETPTDFWMIYKNFAQGTGGWNILRGEQTTSGLQSVTNSGSNQFNVRVMDLGAAFQLKAAAIATQGRGHTGNGSTDFQTVAGFVNANISGTQHNIVSESFITDNINYDYSGTILAGPSAACRSIAVFANGTGTLLYPTRFVTGLETVIYGLCNAGQIKPSMSVYVDSIPTNVLELMP